MASTVPLRSVRLLAILCLLVVGAPGPRSAEARAGASPAPTRAVD